MAVLDPRMLRVNSDELEIDGDELAVRDEYVQGLASGPRPNLLVDPFRFARCGSAFARSDDDEAARLNGSDDHVTVPDETAWDLVGDFTVALWVRSRSTSLGDVALNADQSTPQLAALKLTGTSPRYIDSGALLQFNWLARAGWVS